MKKVRIKVYGVGVLDPAKVLYEEVVSNDEFVGLLKLMQEDGARVLRNSEAEVRVFEDTYRLVCNWE